jgi:hypothetical protein
MSIPNTLTIYINTNIPGRKFIKYSPSMTIKTMNKSVYFDPLIKLSNNIINKIPSQYVPLQFFDKYLFKNLIYNSNNLQPNINIQQATNDGIIDNNIEITLNNLFKSNNIFYINNQPYTIYSCQWEKGNWKIDKKIKPNYNDNKYMITKQIKKSNKELSSLPSDVIEGPYFNANIIDPLVKYQLIQYNYNMEVIPYNPINTTQNNNIKYLNYNVDSELNISYYIVIQLYLYPGNYIPTNEKYKIGCNNQFNKLKNSWSELLGKPPKNTSQPYYYPQRNRNIYKYRAIANINKNTRKKRNQFYNRNKFTKRYYK